MAGPKNPPARILQRRSGLHHEEEPPMRTRSGRGSKPASKGEKPEPESPKASFESNDSTLAPRKKNSRNASTISNYADIDSAPDVYATYEAPYLMVFGLSREFFDGLKYRRQSRSVHQINHAGLASPGTPFDDSEDDEESPSEESDVPTPPHSSAKARGRGGRATRGGPRGRGVRGKVSRGGRAKATSTRTTSPLRTRPSRNAAPMFPLTEEDDEESTNQNSPMADAKEHDDPEEEELNLDQHDRRYDLEDVDHNEAMEGIREVSFTPTTPPGSPPAELVTAYDDPLLQIPVPVSIPRISLPRGSGRPTPRAETLTPPIHAVPKLLDPEDDTLSDADLPEPWLSKQPPPVEDECEDQADYLLQNRFKPMTDVQGIIAALTKFPIAHRRTETLYALAANTQRVLKAWQDEYLELDARTAPHAHPPKKACNGGRIPANPALFENLKEADLYGYTYDAKKGPGLQDPFAQRRGREKPSGRELRTRRARDALDSAAPSEDDEAEEREGRPVKRQRRATTRFDGSDNSTGANTPKKHSGWGGARKKGVSKYAQPQASATPEPEVRGRRARVAASSLLHQRIQEMREESAVTSSGDEGVSNTNNLETEDVTSHSVAQQLTAGDGVADGRGGPGVQKKAKKRACDEVAPAPPAYSTNAPPPALQSMSEGQGLFAIDISTDLHDQSPVRGGQKSIFQTTPHSTLGEVYNQGQSAEALTPEDFTSTTPMREYSPADVDDSAGNNSASASKKKPRVKSEKRSHSMTIWWAERKARMKEVEEKMGTTAKNSTAKASSSATRKASRPLAVPPASKYAPEPLPRLSPTYAEPAPPPPTIQDGYMMHSIQPQTSMAYSAPSPSEGYPHIQYVPAPSSLPSMLKQASPLAAPPSGPPPAMSSGIPGPIPSSHSGVAVPGRALAPAPLAPQHSPAYPSPYGPRTAPRLKSHGPLPLAPAPSSHVSPYAPIAAGPAQRREMPFKVMIPGPLPSSGRRESQ